MLSGVVESVNSERPGLVTLEIRADNTTVWAKVSASITGITGKWIDAEVRASGVLASVTDGGRVTSSTLWISDTGAVEITHPAEPLPTLPVSKIGALLAVDPTRPPPHRVRVRGMLYEPVQGGTAVVDDSGRIPVRMGQVGLAPDLRVLDVAGFLAWEHGSPVLKRVVQVAAGHLGDLEDTPAPGSILTTALQVHQLPMSAAQRAYPVRLRAIVTYFDPVNGLLFVQDRSDGIFVEMNGDENASMRAGDDVEVAGVTIGSFAPDVAKPRIKILGHAHLPAPKIASFERANLGSEDCRWIELGGVVEHVAQRNGDALLTLAWGRNTYKAHVLAPAASLMHLVDAEVKLRGVCGALFNRKNQILGLQMFVPGAECIRVVRAPSPDPFAMSLMRIADLLRFSRARNAPNMTHLVRLCGVVTYANRSGPAWVRDASGGVMIQDNATPGLAVGDLVDVVGFPAISGFSPALRGTRVKRLQSGAPPAPVRITAKDAMNGDFDGQLVQIEGKLVDRPQQPADWVLTVASGGMIFTAHLRGDERVQPLQPGSRLRLTGICSVETEQSSDLITPWTFRLLLRSPADILIVGRPPWLTVDRVVPILGGAVFLIVAALAWVGLLRRRVRTQTSTLHAQTVLLQAAHRKTREALHKACEAEALDRDSKQILELIARDEPVDLIVDHIAEAVAVHCEGAVCVILLGGPRGSRIWVVPALPNDWTEVLGRIPINSVSFSPEFREPKAFSEDPGWADFIEVQHNSRFRTFCSTPIVVASATVGVIAAFFRQEQDFTDGQGAQLGLWSNIAALALDRSRLHDQLSYRAQHDGLTGLPNRALLYEKLEAEIEMASREESQLGVLYIDLDGFKQINDTHGHDAGDAVLQDAAKRMTRAVRRGDTVARIGGDEFVVLLPRLSRSEDAERIAAKIAEALREPIYVDRQRLAVGASSGIAIWPLDGDRPDSLLRFADAQMYGAKRRRWYDATTAHSNRKT